MNKCFKFASNNVPVDFITTAGSKAMDVIAIYICISKNTDFSMHGAKINTSICKADHSINQR